MGWRQMHESEQKGLVFGFLAELKNVCIGFTKQPF